MNEKINWRKWRVLLIFTGVIMFVMVISGPGCGQQWMLFYDKPIKGYVVDVDTGKPIEGVIVVGLWDLAQYFGHGSGGYAKVIVATTDKEGKFKLPFWVTFKPWTFHSGMNEIAPKIVIYKPGYKIDWSHKIMRLGFPRNTAMTEEEKNQAREKYSLNPVKVEKLSEDEEIWKNHKEFRSEAHFPDEYYSKIQLTYAFKTLKSGIEQMPIDNNKSKMKILKDVEEDTKYWVEGKK